MCFSNFMDEKFNFRIIDEASKNYDSNFWVISYYISFISLFYFIKNSNFKIAFQNF